MHLSGRGEGGGRAERVRGERTVACVCGWYLRFFHSRKKAIVQTKQQEMKFAKMSLCHLLCFLLTAKVLL